MSTEATEPPFDSDVPVPISEDVMARILEPRVKTNAKNNYKGTKIAFVPETETSETSTMRPPATPAPDKIEEIANDIGQIRESLAALQKQGGARDQAFDLLYEELGGYKNDFYYERLKPTLRSLLFLLDSIEQFERELDAYEQNGEVASHEVVKSNLSHFRDQLTDALSLSELAPLEDGGEEFNPRTQRAVQLVKVDASQNNTVQRQIRSGWTLGSKIFRPADVVVGKSDAK